MGEATVAYLITLYKQQVSHAMFKFIDRHIYSE